MPQDAEPELISARDAYALLGLKCSTSTGHLRSIKQFPAPVRPGVYSRAEVEQYVASTRRLSPDDLRVADVVRLTGCSENSIRDWRRKGKFPKPSYRVVRGRRIPVWARAEAEGWVATRATAPKDALNRKAVLKLTGLTKHILWGWQKKGFPAPLGLFLRRGSYECLWDRSAVERAIRDRADAIATAIDLPTVLLATGLSTLAVERLRREGKFPAPIPAAAGKRHRLLWSRREIKDWAKANPPGTHHDADLERVRSLESKLAFAKAKIKRLQARPTLQPHDADDPTAATIQGNPGLVVMLLSELFQDALRLDAPKAASAAREFCRALPGCVVRVPSMQAMARWERDLAVMASLQRDPSEAGVNRVTEYYGPTKRSVAKSFKLQNGHGLAAERRRRAEMAEAV